MGAASSVVMLFAALSIVHCIELGEPVAPCPFSECDGACIDTTKDRAHCGACGVACNSGEVCSAGSCAVSCQAGLTECDSTCTNTDIDAANCGACGTKCAGGELCDGKGKCVGGATGCSPGLIVCNDTCVDPNIDERFCGASGDCMGTNAGTVCADGELCDGMGTCALSCQTGLINCNGTCINPDTDESFCGATGDCSGASAGTACADGELCDGTGKCALSCQAGLIDCGGTCTDPKTDESFCGATGDCTGANNGDVCAPGFVCNGAGVCALSCQAGLTNCNNTCTNTDFDPKNCKTCGTVCPGGVCSAGTCGATGVWQFVGVGNSTFASTVSSVAIGTLPAGATKVAFGVWAGESEDFDLTGNQGNYTMSLGTSSCTRSDAPWVTVEGECIVVSDTQTDFLYDNNYPNSSISECDIQFTAATGAIVFSDTSASEDCGFAVYALMP